MPDLDLDPDSLVTVAELARWLRISRTAAYKLVDSGDVASILVGGSIRIPASSALAYIDARYRPARVS